MVFFTLQIKGVYVMNIVIQDKILALTKQKLQNKDVDICRKIHSMGGGIEEKIWTINQKIKFIFRTEEYGKKILSLVISMNGGETKQNFNDKEFANNMHNLFVERERQQFQDFQDEKQKMFLDDFQAKMK
ncbi:MAG: hypothetical protein IKB59_00040 [Alphaproteobacteria bacterium]|nr:hypothetical protein [Alphaproteobacteria bacterium]